MYTVDAYLFAEPFADRLGDVWDRGRASAARLVEAVATPGGQALPVGPLDRRSRRVPHRRAGGPAAPPPTRAGRRRPGGVDPGAGGLARAAADGAVGWFDGGLVVAHKRRAPFRYRGRSAGSR